MSIFSNRRFRNLPNSKMMKNSEGEHNPNDPNWKPVTDWCDETEATLVTSLCDPTFNPLHGSYVTQHMPVIDLDVECHLVPSSTEGHSHLYINRPVSPEGLMEILEVLAKHGIVERGYAAASKARGYSAVRHPRVKKDRG